MLPTASSTSPQISQADRAALTDAKNSLVGDDLTRPLAPDVRQRLATYVAETEQFRLPATETEVAREIAALMVAFKSARAVATDEAMAMTREYADLLSDMPLWAIRVGFRQVKLGEADGVSLDFPPSAPRLRKVVTDVMVPLLADRHHIQRVLAAREAPPENPDMAKRVADISKNALNPMQQKYGPTYGLGGVLPANEIGTAAAPRPGFKAMNWDAITDHYQRTGMQHLVGGDDRNGYRNDDVTDDVAFQDRAAGAR